MYIYVFEQLKKGISSKETSFPDHFRPFSCFQGTFVFKQSAEN